MTVIELWGAARFIVCVCELLDRHKGHPASFYHGSSELQPHFPYVLKHMSFTSCTLLAWINRAHTQLSIENKTNSILKRDVSKSLNLV